jgi:hypothetical protein
MQQHLYQTVELLKNRISKNLEKVRINETMIKEAIANNQFKDLDIYIKELHAENRKILEENAEAIKIQLDIIQFINKYKNNWTVESIVTEINSLKDLSEEELFKYTIEDKIPYNRFHPKYGNEEFINRLMEHYLLNENYEMCNILLKSKKVI